MRLRTLCALVLCVVLGSCSRMPILSVINNMGVAVDILTVVSVDDEGYDRVAKGWQDGFCLPHHRQIDLLRDERGFWRLQIRIGGCRVWYQVPSTAYVGIGDTIVQLEPTSRMYLIDEVWFASTPDVNKPRYENHVVRADGFPVSPSRTECGEF